jgi:hypothetical protein
LPIYTKYKSKRGIAVGLTRYDLGSHGCASKQGNHTT